MRQLSDYIVEQTTHYKNDYDRECYLNSMIDFFEDDLPEGFSKSVNNLEFKDYILESLTTHDVNILKQKIEHEFPDIECNFINDKKQALQIISNVDLSCDETLKNLVNVFGFYISKTNKSKNLFVIDICPTYAKDAHKIVSDNHNKLYHFTAAKYAEEIETKGLRCKSSSYRKYPERVYLYASDKPLNKIQDIDKFIKLVTSPYDRRDYGLIVYRIDLSKMTTKTHINFYTDDCMEEENAVYTYNSIPPECITKIEYELK